jgi:putative Holliday junction resolvase
MRVLGVDVGRRRIGLAVSDATGTLATPLQTVQLRPGKRPPLAKIEGIARGLGVEHLVVGLPLDAQGRENAWCAEVRELGEQLGERLGVKVSFVDERFTSRRAERAVRALGLPRAKRQEKNRVDRAAAQLILQAFLDRPEIAR